MNQVKIGKFIASCRKNQNLTQMQLAETLGITDRAVSKWENGKSMPDSSIMLELCEILNITVTDLLSGEVVTMEHYNEQMQNNLLDMVKAKEESDKRLLRMEIVLGLISVLPLVAAIILINIISLEEWLSAVIALISLIPLLIATPFAIQIEQKAGYYQCKKCAHRYVPTYGSVFAAMHMGRTRYLKCPNCHKYSWNKKVLTQE